MTNNMIYCNKCNSGFSESISEASSGMKWIIDGQIGPDKITGICKDCTNGTFDHFAWKPLKKPKKLSKKNKSHIESKLKYPSGFFDLEAAVSETRNINPFSGKCKSTDNIDYVSNARFITSTLFVIKYMAEALFSISKTGSEENKRLAKEALDKFYNWG